MAKKKIVTVNDVISKQTEWNMNEGMSQSLLTAWQSCRVRFVLTVNGWTHVDGQKQTAFGSMVHDVLEHLYKSETVPTEDVITALVDNYNFDVNVSEQDAEFDKAKAHALLCEYVKHYEKDWVDKKFIATESEFFCDFAGYKIKGKIDGQYRAKNGKIWLMEHKTRSQINEDNLLQRLQFDVQNLMYITGAEITQGIAIQGCLYNLIRKPSMYVRKDENPSSFGARLTDDIKKRPEFYFMRYEIPYTKKDKEVFRKELEMKLKEIDMMLKGDLAVYKNEQSCESPWRCRFLEACSSGKLTNYYKGEVSPELGGKRG